MAVFIDTTIFVAVRNRQDKNHVRARQLMERALKGEFGRLYTSDYVADEAITTALTRTHNHTMAVNTGRYIIESPRIERMFIGNEEFKLAWEKFQKLQGKFISFTDCSSLALLERHRINRIMSFDSDFDGLLSRVY